jgi:hypothetical protein
VHPFKRTGKRAADVDWRWRLLAHPARKQLSLVITVNIVTRLYGQNAKTAIKYSQ